jgi:hypothetical protein
MSLDKTLFSTHRGRTLVGCPQGAAILHRQRSSSVQRDPMLHDTPLRKISRIRTNINHYGRFMLAVSLQELRVRCFDPNALMYAMSSVMKVFALPFLPTLLYPLQRIHLT